MSGQTKGMVGLYPGYPHRVLSKYYLNVNQMDVYVTMLQDTRPKISILIVF